MTGAIVQFDLPVVRLDLGRQRVEPDAERLDELARDERPVHVGSGGEVRGPGAGRPRELAQILGCYDGAFDAGQARREHRDLLAHRRRRRGLAVRAREHSGGAMLVGEFVQPFAHRAQSGEPHALDGALHGEGVRQRIHVLAGRGEVGQLGDALEAEARQTIADEVLDGLDVVPGDRLALGEPGDLVGPERAVQLAQRIPLGVRQRRRIEQ